MFELMNQIDPPPLPPPQNKKEVKLEEIDIALVNAFTCCKAECKHCIACL